MAKINRVNRYFQLQTAFFFVNHILNDYFIKAGPQPSIYHV
jgi:hypothetical protein